MGISYSYDITPGGQSNSGNIPTEQWIFVPHTFTPVPPNNLLIRSKLNGANTIITADVYAALEHCQSFRTLAAHAQEIGKKIPALNTHQAEIIGILKKISATGLLIEKQAYFHSLAATSTGEEAASSIAIICIRTCDRPAAIQRLLSSMATSGISADASLKIVVIDDSRSTGNQALNAEAIIAADDNQPATFEYFGPQQQSAFKAALIEALPEHAASIDFLLSRPAEITAETPGIPLNFALLLSAGKKLALLDDDAVCDTYLPTVSAEGPRITSRDRCGKLLKNDASWQQPANTGAAQLLADYSHALGATLPDMIATYELDSSSLSELTLADLEYIHKQSRVLVTGCGTVGDPGTGSNGWAFGQGLDYLNDIADTEDDYNTLLYNRNAWVGVSRLSLQPDYGLMTTTLTGMDNRALLPPTIPYFRNEDMMLGTLTNAIHPASLKLEFPLSLAHLPEPRRQWREKSTASAYSLSVGSFLPDYLQQRVRAANSTSAQGRLQYFASVLKDLGNTNQPQLTQAILDHLARNHSDSARTYMDMLQTTDTIKPWVKKDLQQAIRMELQAIEQPSALTFSDLDAIATFPEQLKFLKFFALQMGESMESWPHIRIVASALRQSTDG